MKSQDFYVGAKIVLRKFCFELIGSDEFTLKFMEEHAFDYPLANINLILNKIREAVASIYKEFFTKYLGNDIASFASNAFVCTATTRTALIDLLDGNITEHEIITFIRYFVTKTAHDGNQSLAESAVRSLIQMELTKSLWDDLENIKIFIYHLYKKDDNDCLSDKELYKVITACRLPIPNELIAPMMKA